MKQGAVTVAQLAERWSLSVSAIRRRCATGVIPTLPLFKMHRIPMSFVEAQEEAWKARFELKPAPRAPVVGGVDMSDANLSAANVERSHAFGNALSRAISLARDGGPEDDRAEFAATDSLIDK